MPSLSAIEASLATLESISRCSYLCCCCCWCLTAGGRCCAAFKIHFHFLPCEKLTLNQTNRSFSCSVCGTMCAIQRQRLSNHVLCADCQLLPDHKIYTLIMVCSKIVHYVNVVLLILRVIMKLSDYFAKLQVVDEISSILNFLRIIIKLYLMIRANYWRYYWTSFDYLPVDHLRAKSSHIFTWSIDK